MTPHALAVASAAGLAAPALAQTPSFTSDTTISMPLSWSEVNGNNNGILEPGESAEIRMDLSFTNQFGLAHFAPPIGTFSSGTILALGSGYIDINGAGGTEGAFTLVGPVNNGTSGYGVRVGFRIVGSASHGSVNGAGTGITEIQFGQFPVEKPWTLNPIQRLYAFLWTPSSYAARSVTFGVSGHAPPAVASVMLDLDGSVGAYAYATQDHLSLGSVTIPIAPAPPAAAAFAFLALARRRRPPQGDSG